MLTAKEASALVEKCKQDNLNYQRIYMLDLIKRTASKGNDYLVLDIYPVMLFPDDYEFFRNLGYEIIEPKREVKGDRMYNTFGVIKW